jgi:cell division protein FtsB
MTQRRTPSGQGPARRSSPTARPGVRTSASRGTTRVEPRSGEPRATVTRIPTSRATRPVATRRTASAGAATKRTVAPRPRAFTGRATLLIVVLVALALGYTYPVRVYLAQESQIGKMQAAQAAQREKINNLNGEVVKWADPEYVRIQARERLFYVRPGEVPLLPLNDPAGAARDAGKPVPKATADSWYDTLWGSVEAANAEPLR